MGKYEGINCPICGEPLENGKVVVICPECGAPYHKECVEKTGKCIYDELHAQHRSWEPPKRQAEKQYAGDEPRRCSRCGSLNPVDGLFCEVCGNPLVHPENTSRQQRPNMDDPRPNMGQGYYGPQGGPFGQGPYGRGGAPYGQPHHIPYDPYTTPFGGVNADESIDNIPVRDWAIYIGQNTQYFIPKFKEMSEKRGGSGFNFAAMFFGGMYFLYRKMYLWGAMLLVANLLLEIPGTLYMVTRLPAFSTALNLNLDVGMLVTLANVCSMLRLALMVVCGLFANRLYKIHCTSKITAMSQQGMEHHQYVSRLSQAGGVSMKVILVLLLIYLLGSMLSVLLL